MDQLKDSLQQHPVLSTGLSLAVCGAAFTLGRSGFTLATQAAKRRFIISLEVTSRDRAFPWILGLLDKKTASRHVTLNSVHQSIPTAAGEAVLPGGWQFNFTPRPGKHLVCYKDLWFSVERTREEKSFNLQDGAPFETVTVSTLRTKHSERLLLHELLHEAMQLQEDSRMQDYTVIYRNWGTEWRPFGSPRLKRPLDSVILDLGVGERLLKDVQEFLKAETAQWYLQRGIPYRRGYLLHGSPGSGKTSFISALAGEIGWDICVLNLNEPGLTDDRLQHAMVNLPSNCLLLLEDIDAAFVKRDASADRYSGMGTQVTFSGLLNTLDGVVAGEQRLVFMTTNHLEVLDPALIRPGRVDYSIEVGAASKHQCEKLFSRFYPQSTVIQAGQFCAAIEPALGLLSMAQLQGYLLMHKELPDRAVSEAHLFISAILGPLKSIKQVNGAGAHLSFEQHQ
eukprot:TRINITY_DN17180_c0_g1_i1.p1 TRINITY_DN17180_c0_g1~~TRINITY_DN17180_c0_g1_i1.p1  ORF type:complete len:459 (-),score=106.87 TRINITY_DN17180_c0_g1_i1:161-1516(-)